MKRIGLIFSLSVIVLVVTSNNVFSSSKADTENLVNRATTVVQSFSVDPDLEWFRKKVKEAKAVLIIPQSIKGAFFIGGSGGSGVLVAQDGSSGAWGNPAFYTIGSISIGVQFGGEASEVILMVMTDRGMEKLLTSSFKLGADITLAAGPIGGSSTVATADVLSYSRSKGAFVGMSLDGAVVKTRDKMNEAYYGKAVSPTDIIIRKNVANDQAAQLQNAIAEITAN